MNRDRAILNPLRQSIQASRRKRRPAFETLEQRQMLAAAPVGVNDNYVLPNIGTLTVGNLAGSLAPSDIVEPFPEFTPSSVLAVTNGRMMGHPGMLALGNPASEYDAILVSDPRSNLTINQWLSVGQAGQAKLTVSRGGTLHTANWTEIGYGIGSAGDALITDPGTRWTNTNFLSIGDNGGRARFTLANGALLQNNNWTEIGNDGAHAEAIVTGANTRWNNVQFFIVGSNGGHGLFTLSDGAVLNTGNWAEIGYGGAFGRANLSGANTRWTNTNHFSVGENGGHGVLNITDGAKLDVGAYADIGYAAGSRGEVTISGAGSRWSIQERLEVSSNGGESVITLINGGELVALGPMRVFNGARIRGDGLLRAGSIDNEGLLDPGAHVGILHVQSNITQTDNAGLEIEIRGNQRGTSYDGLDVVGSYEADGRLRVRFTNGFAPKAGDEFVLVQATSVNGAYDIVGIQGLEPGFTHRIVVADGMVKLIATNDGVALPVQPQDDGVLINDSDPDGDRLSAILVEQPLWGSLQLFANGSFRYIASPNFDGVDTFRYKATDGFLNSAPVLVTIQNLRPTAVDDSYSIIEDTVWDDDEVSILENDSDPENDLLTAHLVLGPAHGTLTLNSDGTFEYTPDENFFGTDTFTYQASDGLTRSRSATVTLVVPPVNDPPIANPDRKMVVAGQTLQFPAGDLTVNDIDPDGDALLVIGVGTLPDTHGTVELEGGNITYVPDAGFVGTARFTYRVHDPSGEIAEGLVHVEVKPSLAAAGRVQGVGSLDGSERFFAFSADNRRGTTSGNLLFVDLENRLFFTATTIDQLNIAADGSKAVLAGIGRVNGRSGFRFVVTIEDGARRMRRDTFRIEITGPIDFQYDSLQHAEQGGRIDRVGEIRIMPVQPMVFASFASLARQAVFADLAADSTSIKPKTAKLLR